MNRKLELFVRRWGARLRMWGKIVLLVTKAESWEDVGLFEELQNK